MKKLPLILSSIALVCMLGLSAQAVTLSNANRGVTASVDAQARMLQQLGLFLGTEEGFELERAMTRDEAAAMLVRYLGAETKARTGTWKHPFTDVAPWAQQYVGWLYQSGLTKGVSQTKYGAGERVTAEQFCVFLSRAASGADDYLIADEAERAACDKAGFTRGDAVVLSARALDAQYMQHDNQITMAQFMIDKGVFTTEQFKDAAWDVLPREYANKTARADDYGALRLSCVIAGMRVLRNEAVAEMTVQYDPVGCVQTYGMTLENGQHILHRINRETLAIERLKAFSISQLVPIGSIGGTDYLGVPDFSKDSPVYAIQGTEITALPHKIKDGNPEVAIHTKDAISYPTDGGTCVIDASGIRVQSTADETVFAMLEGCNITVEQSEAQTIVRSRNLATGLVIDSYTIPNRYDLAQSMYGDTQEGREYALALFAPNLLNHNSKYLWGTAGIYEMQGGRLTQITARPVIDYGYDAADGSIVVISHKPEKRVGYSGGGISHHPAGDEVVRIRADGTEELLLSNTPAHGMTLTSVSYATGGKVRVVYQFIMGMADMHRYEYAVENGKLRALQHEAGSGWSGYDDPAKEQQRLDALGVGINS